MSYLIRGSPKWPASTPNTLSPKPIPTVKLLQEKIGLGLPSGKEYYLLMQEMQEMQVRSLGGEDPLEEEMATHSSIFAWRIPWTEEIDGLQSIGSQRDGHD